MKKRMSVLALITLLYFPVCASGAVLLSENFSSTTISDGLTISGDPLQNLNQWIDFPNSNRWAINTTDGYAQHMVQTSDNTNLLFYGIGTPVTAGTQFTFSFDYVASNRSGQVVVAGLTNGSTSLDPFAPWFSPGDTNDGVTLFSQSLAQTGSWQSVNYSFMSTGNFDAIAVGFMMGGTSGLRGVDNVSLASAPVPEPSTVLLFGAGLAGLAAVGRRKRN